MTMQKYSYLKDSTNLSRTTLSNTDNLDSSAIRESSFLVYQLILSKEYLIFLSAIVLNLSYIQQEQRAYWLIRSKLYLSGISSLLMTRISLNILSTNRWKFGLTLGVMVYVLDTTLTFRVLLLPMLIELLLRYKIQLFKRRQSYFYCCFQIIFGCESRLKKKDQYCNFFLSASRIIQNSSFETFCREGAFITLYILSYKSAFFFCPSLVNRVMICLKKRYFSLSIFRLTNQYKLVKPLQSFTLLLAASLAFCLPLSFILRVDCFRSRVQHLASFYDSCWIYHRWFFYFYYQILTWFCIVLLAFYQNLRVLFWITYHLMFQKPFFNSLLQLYLTYFIMILPVQPLKPSIFLSKFFFQVQVYISSNHSVGCLGAALVLRLVVLTSYPVVLLDSSTKNFLNANSSGRPICELKINCENLFLTSCLSTALSNLAAMPRSTLIPCLSMATNLQIFSFCLYSLLRSMLKKTITRCWLFRLTMLLIILAESSYLMYLSS